jgi:hypothetical protein
VPGIDWIKYVSSPTTTVTAVTAVVAYFAGIYSESFKKKLLNRSERNRLRNALYAELGTNLRNLMAYQFIPSNPADNHLELYPELDKWFRTEVYDTALKQQPVLFHEIKEAPFFSEFYVFVRHANEKNEFERILLLKRINHHLNDLFNEGRLSRRKTAAPYYSYKSRMRIPFSKRLYRLMGRNMERGFLYQPPDTFRQKIRALWLGRTDKFPRPPIA